MRWKRPTAPRLGLLLAPAPIQAVWLGKALAGLLLLLVAQMFFLPAAVVFLSQEIGALWPVGLGTLLLVDVGMCALGSLLGALSQGGAARESLLSIVLFPLWCPCCWRGSAWRPRCSVRPHLTARPRG